MATNGDLILTQSAGGTAWQWESGSGTRRGAALPVETGVVAAAFSPGDTLVATAFADGTAQVWDARTGLQLGDRLRHDGAIRSLAFNAAGTMVVTAADDSTAKVWDAGSGAMIGSPLMHDMDLWSAVFSADGRRVVAAGPPVPVRRMFGSMSGLYFNPAKPPDDFTATVWPVRSALTGTRLPDAALATLEIRRDGRRALTIRSSGDERWAQHAALDEDGGDAELLVTEARLWDMRSGAPVGDPLRHGGHVFSAVFSSDGAVIATAGSDSTVRLWNAEDGRPLGAPLKHPAAVLAAGLDAKGARVLSAAADGQLRVWDVRTGTLAVPPTPTIDRIREVAFSPDGACVLLTMSSPWSPHMQFALEASSLQPMGLLAAGDLRPQSISADGSRGVVVNRDNNDMPVNGAVLHVSNAAGTTAIPLPLSGVVTASAFSMDGSLLVTAYTDSTARIWHAATGAAQSVPLAHRAAVAAVAFSLDGTRLVTASADSTMRVWDTRTGTPVGAPLALGDSVHSVRFSPDGQYVITRTMHDTTALHVVRTVNEADRAGVLDLAQLVLNARMRGPRDFVRGVPERAARLQAWRTRARGWADAPDGSFEQWAHWYLADPAAGAPQPGRWPQSARR